MSNILEKIVLTLAVTLAFGAIKDFDLVKAQQAYAIEVNDNKKIKEKYNDIAMFLAGMNSEDSEFYSLTFNPDWQKYSTISKANWSTFSAKKSKIQKWTKEEIEDILNEETVFYPFSGPDILYANIFFPNAKKYIMFGLEPVGTIPDLEKADKPYFDLLNLSLKDILNLSFFVSKDMNYELNNKEINGVIPILLLFLARTNNEIIDIKPVEINNDGNINYLNDFVNKRGSGVEIYFKNKNKKDIQTLYYFSADLSNRSLLVKKTKSYFENMEGAVTYIKSASYLMHTTDFSAIRNIVLNKSNFILQDDSGIPFHDFDRNIWNIDLYGIYIRPIESFKDKFQEDLKAAYENSKSLNFMVGYGKKPNLLLARKIR